MWFFLKMQFVIFPNFCTFANFGNQLNEIVHHKRFWPRRLFPSKSLTFWSRRHCNSVKFHTKRLLQWTMPKRRWNRYLLNLETFQFARLSERRRRFNPEMRRGGERRAKNSSFHSIVPLSRWRPRSRRRRRQRITATPRERSSGRMP